MWLQGTTLQQTFKQSKPLTSGRGGCHYVKLTYIYPDGSFDISDMDHYYASEKDANEALDFFNNNQSIPDGVKKIVQTVEHKYLAIYI